MSRRRILMIVFAVIGAWAIVEIALNIHWFLPAAERDFRLELSGTPGQQVSGTYSADGIDHDFNGVVPAKIAVRAKQLRYTISKTDQPGELRGVVFVDDVEAGRTSFGGPTGYVRGAVEQGKSSLQTGGPDAAPAEF